MSMLYIICEDLFQFQFVFPTTDTVCIREAECKIWGEDEDMESILTEDLLP